MQRRVIFESNGLMKVRFSGRFDWRCLVDCLKRLAQCGDSRPLICDMNAVDFDVPSDEMIAAAWTYASGDAATKIAFLAEEPLGIGMLRMFVGFLGEDSGTAMVFTDESEALDWLASSIEGHALTGSAPRG